MAAETSHTEIVAWTKGDNKARSEIILSICPSELKQLLAKYGQRSMFY
jgi:predicted Fe-S protein YdhL (DUF1289 family)